MRIALSPVVLMGAIAAAQELVVVDYLGSNHGQQRQTTIRKVKAGPNGVVFRIERKIFPAAHMHYSKSDQPPFVPPILSGAAWLYPSRYSFPKGVDKSDKDSNLYTFDEAVEIVLMGHQVSALLSARPNEPISKEVTVQERKRTRASIGLVANGLIEAAVDAGFDGGAWSPLLKDLGGGERGFVGVRVEDVLADGPSARSGMRKGDLVLRIGSTPVENDRSLEIACDYAEIGRPVEIVFGRRDRTGFKLHQATVMPVANRSTEPAP